MCSIVVCLRDVQTYRVVFLRDAQTYRQRVYAMHKRTRPCVFDSGVFARVQTYRVVCLRDAQTYEAMCFCAK